MIDVIKLIASVLASTFKSRARLEAEILVLRHQPMILRRRAPPRPRIRVVDRLIFLWLYRLQPSVVDAVCIVRPETVVRWHRLGFRTYWRRKSCSPGGRPPISSELRRLIREMSGANPLWGAPRIHGELLKLGIEVAQSTVAKYMARFVSNRRDLTETAVTPATRNASFSGGARPAGALRNEGQPLNKRRAHALFTSPHRDLHTTNSVGGKGQHFQPCKECRN
jgi:hypothetical protein